MLSPNGIRAVLFDLDGTLRCNDPSSEQVFFGFAAELGVPDSPEARREAMRWAHYYWAQSEDLMADLETFAGLTPEFWTNYARRHLISYACPAERANTLAEQMRDLMEEQYKPKDSLVPGVVETLEHLQAAGFLLGVVSNRMNPFRDLLQALGIDDYFDFTLAAGEVNVYKPDPEIFAYALALTGTQPHETIYVGDNYYADAVGAQRAGLRAVLLDPEGVFPDYPVEIIQSMPGLLDLLGE